MPYETLFFNFVLSAFFITKKSVIRDLLNELEKYKDDMSFCDCQKQSIFRKLSCGYETEFLIFRAVMDYFYVCYGIDVNLLTTLSCEVYEGNSNLCGVYIPRLDELENIWKLPLNNLTWC